MPNAGIEPATLRSLTRRSNKLSYAAAQNYHYLLYMQTFYDKSILNKKQFFVTHLDKIGTIFTKSTQTFSIFLLHNSKK